MSIWSPSDIILTKTGEEILSKVQAGVGQLTLSRVVIGKSSSANLYNLTAIPNIAQEGAVIGVTTNNEGSAIEIQVSNAGLLAEYDLYQIGIYVTHMDYLEEQLYMVAQCTEPDHIELPTTTPLLLNFSLYLVHTGTSNVNIEVSNAGLVTIYNFTLLQGIVNSHVEDLSLHKKIEVIDGAIPVSNPNTLLFKIIG